jgi:uncharacterized OsmC-like protein
MKALVQSMGGVASRVRVGGHDLIFDQPPGVPGGQDRGPSPLDVLGVSVAACVHYFAAAYLWGRHLSTDGLTVEVETEKERVPVARIGRLGLKVRLPPGLDDRQIAGIERAIKSCPAYGTMLHSPSLELTIEAGSAAADRRHSA